MHINFLEKMRILKTPSRCSIKNFVANIQSKPFGVIGEIKRASPSLGAIDTETALPDFIERYIQQGVVAFSVLTETEYFKGSMSDLQFVADYLATHYPTERYPVLCKDFILDNYQIDTAYRAGADAVLLIAKFVGSQLQPLYQHAKALGLEVLVEIHDLEDLALIEQDLPQVRLLGVNNRNLTTLEVDTNCALDIFKHLPAKAVKIAESGIVNHDMLRKMYSCGYDGALIGAGLVTNQLSIEVIDYA